MFVYNLAPQASLLQKNYNSARESRSGTAFICSIVILLFYCCVAELCTTVTEECP